MLDEKALRKPGFKEGHRIRLADGQEWSFPKPRLIFKPKIADGKIDFDGGPSFGPEFDDNIEALFGVRRAEPPERLRIKFEMAVRLLLTNYDLKPDDFCELLVLEVNDPESDARWEAIDRVLMGLSPKPSPAT
jgi:hypothetical protein